MNKVVLAGYMLAVGLVAFFGAYLLWKGVHRLMLASASTKWPTTKGKVTGAETKREVTSDTDDNHPSVTFSADTAIAYTVNGQQYTTNIMYFGQTLGSGDKSEAALQVLRYPVGKEVTVSYDPENPAGAVLKPGIHSEALWLPGAGLAFLLHAMLLMFIGPGLLKFGGAKDDAFQKGVEQAIEDARAGRPVNEPTPPPQGDKSMALVAAGFGALMAGLGLLALTAGYQRYWYGSASLGWPTAQGTVVVSGADSHDDTTDTAARSRLVYEYDVAGVKHFNNVRSFAQVENGSAHYGKGASVKVSYFPADPDVAALEPGNTKDVLWLPGIGIVLVLFAAATFVFVVPAMTK